MGLQAKLAISGVLLSLLLGLGWGVKHLYTQNVKLEGDLEDAKAHIKGWGDAYAAAAEERAKSDADLAQAEGEKDQAQRHAASLQRQLDDIVREKGGECAITNAPVEYVRTLRDGLPSQRRKAATEDPATGDPGPVPAGDPGTRDP